MVSEQVSKSKKDDSGKHRAQIKSDCVVNVSILFRSLDTLKFYFRLILLNMQRVMHLKLEL